MRTADLIPGFWLRSQISLLAVLAALLSSDSLVRCANVPCASQFYANEQYCFKYKEEVQKYYPAYDVVKVPMFTIFTYTDPIKYTVSCTLGKKKVNNTCSYYQKSLAYKYFAQYSGQNDDIIIYCKSLDTPDLLTLQYKSEAGCVMENTNTLVCQECIPGYGKIYGVCQKCMIDYCINCNENLLQCKQCLAGYYLYNYQCYQCSDNCTKCSSKQFCMTCAASFYLQEEQSSDYCKRCKPYCLECYINDLKLEICKKCGSENGIYYFVDDMGGCQRCDYVNPNVEQCSGDPKYIYNIQSCNQGYFLVNYTCVEKKGKGFCLKVNQLGMCTQCISNSEIVQYLSAGNCVSIDNCIQVEQGDDVSKNASCAKCSAYYYYNEDLKQCQNCANTTVPAERCLCTEKYKCLSCAQLNYYISLDKSKCETFDPNVATYNQQTQKIETCKQGYRIPILSVDGSDLLCIKCKENCTQCISISRQEYCEICNPSFYVDESGQCQQCSNFCEQCTASQCLKCLDKYLLASTGECQPYISHCSKQRDETNQVCLMCDDGYTFNNFSKNCELCNSTINYCTSCQPNTTEQQSFKIICKSCQPSYTLANNTCQIIPHCSSHYNTKYGCEICDFGYYYDSKETWPSCKNLQLALMAQAGSVKFDQKCPDLTESANIQDTPYNGDDLDVFLDEVGASLLSANALYFAFALAFLAGLSW